MTKSLGCYCGGEERWKDREGKGCFQALTQTLMAHNPKRNSIYSLRMYGEEKAEPKQKVLIIEEKADSEQSPALKPHKNCHHCSMQRAHLLTWANTSNPKQFTFISCCHSQEHWAWAVLNPPALQPAQEGNLWDIPVLALDLSTKHWDTLSDIDTQKWDLLPKVHLLHLGLLSLPPPSFLPMQAIPLKEQKPRHQCVKQKLIHTALLTRQSPCWRSARQRAWARFDN